LLVDHCLQGEHVQQLLRQMRGLLKGPPVILTYEVADEAP